MSDNGLIGTSKGSNMNKTTKTEITVCSSCAAGIANDDWTHLDFEHCSQEDSDAAMSSIQGSLELLGWLTHVGPSTYTGYIRCPICGDDAMSAETFTTEKGIA